MMNSSRTSPRKKRRTAWRLQHINNIATCFTRIDFPGYITRFNTGRNDFLVGITVTDGRRLGIVNCHNTSRASADKIDFLCCAFAAAIRLQTGGKDSTGQFVNAVDVLLFAGDLNIKNIFYGRKIDLKQPFRNQKFSVVSCYLVLETGLTPAPFVDHQRGSEIDFLMVSHNLRQVDKIELNLKAGNPSDHEFFGAIYEQTGPLVPCRFGSIEQNITCDWLTLKSNLKAISAYAEVPQKVRQHLETLRSS